MLSIGKLGRGQENYYRATVAQGIEDYYPDELTFAAADFVGLTIEECRLLKFGRDRAFLQS